MKKKPVSPVISVQHPRAHNQFFGHHTQENVVLECFYAGKMPHAWLITGSKGIGKATLAYRMAKFLCAVRENQPRVSTLKVAEELAVSRHIAQGVCGDILVLEEEGGKDISVEEVRKIAHFLHLTSANSPYRIVIIDSVDALNTHAANALLKLLEEPPANSFLFLISHMPGTLLPTIRSRCRMLPLHMPSKQEAMEVVMAHCSTLSREEAETLLLLAGGIPGQAIAFHHNKTIEYYQELLHILAAMPVPDMQEIYKIAELHAAKGSGVAWENFTYLLNRMLGNIIKKAACVALEETLPEERAVIDRFAMQSSLDKWLELWEKIILSFEEATRARLDYKQVTLVIFDMIYNNLAGK